jgi:hypothetical protein
MNVVTQIMKEFVSLFVDDGSLALFSLLLVAAVTLAVKFAALSPLLGGVALFAGCLAILAASTHRAAARRR